MQNLSLTAWKKRAFLKNHIRNYFAERKLWEVDTPILNPTPTVEAHLDSFGVYKSGRKKSPHASHASKAGLAGYLCTSPEYNLKKIVATHKTSVYEIAHCFREGDLGPWHSEEFLMIEYYLVGASLDELMDFTESFLASCTELPFACLNRKKAKRISIDDLFLKHTGRLPLEVELDFLIQKHKLSSLASEKLPFDDKFFLVFLNLLEPHLKEGLWFLHGYPAPLAALSKIQKGQALRFEVYWQGIELGNGYEELQTRQEYEAAFLRENSYRQKAKRQQLPIDQEFLKVLHTTGGLPKCSGIALGLERLLAVLLQKESLSSLSPFASKIPKQNDF